MLGRKPEELEQVALPNSMHEVWKWFLDLHNKRQTGMQPNPLSWADIQAYFSLQSIEPEDWEISLISKLDGIVMSLYEKDANKDAGKN